MRSAPFGWWYGAGLVGPTWVDGELLKVFRAATSVDPTSGSENSSRRANARRRGRQS